MAIGLTASGAKIDFGTALDNLNIWTLCFWFKPGTVAGFSNMVSEDNAGGNIVRLLQTGGLSGVNARAGVRVDYDSTDLFYATQEYIIRPDVWQFVCIVLDVGASDGNRVKVYYGDLSNPPVFKTCSGGFIQEPVGSRVSNANTRFIIEHGGTNFDAASISFFDRELKDSEKVMEWSEPGSALGALLYSDLMGSGNLQIDITGNGNHGTASGTVSNTPHVPLPSPFGWDEPVHIGAGEVPDDPVPPPPDYVPTTEIAVPTAKSGISLTLSGQYGIDYLVERQYHDDLVDYRTIIYVTPSCLINLAHNSQNIVDQTVVGAGGGGTIRYKVDQYGTLKAKWTETNNPSTTSLWPSYSSPFSFDDLEYEAGIPVVGTTGPHPSISPTSQLTYYHRGIVGPQGQEFHTLQVGDDDDVPFNSSGIDNSRRCSDGKEFLFVVGDEALALSFIAVDATGEFYSPKPMAYDIPVIHEMPTYVAGNVELEIAGLGGQQIEWRWSTTSYQDYTAPIDLSTLDADSTNRLFYRIKDQAATELYRDIVYEPAYPSEGEPARGILWENSTRLNEIITRIQDAGRSSTYGSVYSNMKSSDFVNRRGGIYNPYPRLAGHRRVDTWSEGTHLNYLCFTAFPIVVEGLDANSGYEEFVHDCLVDNVFQLDHVGFEFIHDGPAPTRELSFQGYYSCLVAIGHGLSYSWLKHELKASNHSDGWTPVEELRIRDLLASFCELTRQRYARPNAGQSDGNGFDIDMWPTAWLAASVIIARAMENYDSPVYGSAADWMRLATDTSHPTPGYPGINRKTGFYGVLNDTPEWVPSNGSPYFVDALMTGPLFTAWHALLVSGRTIPHWENAYTLAVTGNLTADPSDAHNRSGLGVNSRLPTLAQATVDDWVIDTSTVNADAFSSLSGRNAIGLILYEDDWDSVSSQAADEDALDGETAELEFEYAIVEESQSIEDAELEFEYAIVTIEDAELEFEYVITRDPEDADLEFEYHIVSVEDAEIEYEYTIVSIEDAELEYTYEIASASPSASGPNPPASLLAPAVGALIDSEASLSFYYEILGYEQAILDFSYEITESAIEEAELLFGYEIATSVLTSYELMHTPRGYVTQIIGNQLPYWHAGRRLYGGRTQRVINSLGGYHFTRMLHQTRKMRSSLFLDLVDISEPYQLWLSQRPVARGTRNKVNNLLLNPSLSYTNPYRLGPWGWCAPFLTATGSYSLRHGKGLFGYYATRLTAEDGESISVNQGRDLIIRQGKSLTATVWYAGMRPERDPPEVIRTSGPRLQLSVQYRDGTFSSEEVYLLDDTDGAWVKESVSLTLTKESHRIEVSVIVEDYEGEKVVLDIGGLQLEEGRVSRPWTENALDIETLYLVYPKESFTESTDWGDITYSRQKRIQFNDNYSWEDLVEVVPPDRSELSLATDEVAVSRNILDAWVEESGVQFSVGWRISSNRIQRYNADINSLEVFETMDIFDIDGDAGISNRLFDPGELGVTQVLEALTVVDEWLYVVVKETYLGNTQRVLKICSPYIPWDDPRVECVRDIYLDSGSGTCNSIGAIDGRKDRLLIDVSGTEYVVQLFWDKAASNNQGNLLLRHDPGTGKITS